MCLSVEMFNSAQEKLVSKVLVAAFKDSLSSDIWDCSFVPERHIMSIFKADLTHPNIVAQSNFDVLDGLHRLFVGFIKTTQYKHTNCEYI